MSWLTALGRAANRDQGRSHRAGAHGQQGSRATSCHPVLGLGAGADRGAATIPRAEGPARRRRPTLRDQGRKTCATYHDEHVPESSLEILGHSIGGISYRHYVHRAPLAFRAILTPPQPTAFQALVKGSGSECP